MAFPQRKLERMEDRFSSLLTRLDDAGHDLFYDKLLDTRVSLERLERAYGPQRIAGHGDTVAAFVRRMERAFGARKVEDAASGTAQLVGRLEQAVQRLVDKQDHELGLTVAGLNGLNPEAPLERGYSLVQVKRTGEFLRDPKSVTPGDDLVIRVKDGRVAAVVTDENTDS